jgi:hypothetical protein
LLHIGFKQDETAGEHNQGWSHFLGELRTEYKNNPSQSYRSYGIPSERSNDDPGALTQLDLADQLLSGKMTAGTNAINTEAIVTG